MVKKKQKQVEYPDANLLRFLSNAFLYPDGEWVKSLGIFDSKNGELRKIVDQMQREPLEELQAKYTFLFVSGYPHTPCPPYESVYIEEHMVGSVSDVLLEIYASWGFSVDLTMADHVSTELEFLAFLRTAWSVEGLHKTALQGFQLFFRNHVRQWVPFFADCLKKHTHFDLYGNLAQVLRKTVRKLEANSGGISLD